jgi:L-threonylcarbamoyladenylate synthase
MAVISNCTASIIKDAALALKEGHLVAFPTETVYGLGVDALNESAVKRLYEVKGRPKNHPLIVHISNIELIEKWARKVPDFAMRLTRVFWPGPMTLILPRTDIAMDFITGGQDNVGIRVPSHSLAISLLAEFESQGGLGIAAPSANRFGKVSPTCAADVRAELTNFLSQFDKILDGGPSAVGIESTIIDCTGNLPVILRPGAITDSMINSVLETNHQVLKEHTKNETRAPGVLNSHYSPNAQVCLSGDPNPGDGFIALASIPTPNGLVRLASPANNEDYARVLYKSLRLADLKKLSRVFVIPPIGVDISKAINDRLMKSAIKSE